MTAGFGPGDKTAALMATGSTSPNTTKANATGVKSRAQTLLTRKIGMSRLALFLERLWPRVWPLLAVAAAFLLVSLLEVWPLLDQVSHIALLAVFACAAIAATVLIIRTPWPSRDDSMRRLETNSDIAHRPASSYDDTLTSSAASDPATAAVWQAHRSRLEQLLKRLRVGPPRPDTAQRDPLALRLIVLLLVTAGLGFFGERASDRLGEAFEFRTAKLLANARLDAWVTPPDYTRQPAIMLADGGTAAEITKVNPEARLIEVPEASELITRATGVSVADLRLEVTKSGSEPLILDGSEVSPGSQLVDAAEVVEIRFKLMEDARIRLLVADAEAAVWTFAVDADLPPTIELIEDPVISQRGSMKLTYRIVDDYGVVSSRVSVKRRDTNEQDPRTAWARKDVLTGPRAPHERPPRLTLRVPRGNVDEDGKRTGEAVTHLEVGTHPWAGLPVEMVLEAVDVAGKIGRSQPRLMKMPERRFTKPLARAVVEQRRKLVADARYAGQVVTALDALTTAPELFTEDTQVFLGLRTVRYRIEREPTRAGRNSAIDQLWHIALRIEDGDLSDAERRLKNAQDELSKLLEEGGTEEQIEQAMQELRSAMNDYMQQLQRQAQESPLQQGGQDQNSQMMSQQDLERMMKQIEDMAKSGSREQARQMLAEMRDLLDRMQSGQQAQQSEQARQMQQAMRDLSDLTSEQQKLMDDTFGQQRQQSQQGQQQRGQGQQRQRQQQGGSPRRGPQSAQRGQRGQQGQQQRGPGQPGSGQRGQGQQGQGQQGQGQPGQGGMGQPRSEQELRERQNAIRDQLAQLQERLDRQGMSSDQLDGAQRSMQNAERALQQGDLPTATREQASALDQLRQGAEDMAQQMQQGSPQRFGQNGDTPRDPLGRPQRSEGPDQGTSVKVPDQIDIQRAREILQELRRRLGDAQRQPTELEYIERLLRRF
ncbi:MAG: TIGR02302 family protein [Pseudomonadota bacterium]